MSETFEGRLCRARLQIPSCSSHERAEWLKCRRLQYYDLEIVSRRRVPPKKWAKGRVCLANFFIDKYLSGLKKSRHSPKFMSSQDIGDCRGLMLFTVGWAPEQNEATIH
jgi:hypothetical protein